MSIVRRVMLLAIGLCALLWSAGPPVGWAADDAPSAFGVASHLRADDSNDSSEPQEQWKARPHTMAVPISAWKSAPIHAALASTPSPNALDPVRASRSPNRPAPPAPHHLRHTPLLI